MKIGYNQCDVKYGDKTNLSMLEKSLIGKEVDILVLPELFTTGILFSEKEKVFDLAEPVPDGYTCRRLISMASKYNCYLVGSIIELENGIIYNSAVVIGPEGFVGKQRKIHLTDYEKKYFESGSGFDIFNIKGVKVGIIICFDCWFPEATRILSSKGVQIILHTANIENSLSMEMARIRAIESVSFLVTSNRIGFESSGPLKSNFRGESRIVDVKGNLLSLAGKGEEFNVVEIDPDKAIEKKYDDCADLFSQVRLYQDLYQEI